MGLKAILYMNYCELYMNLNNSKSPQKSLLQEKKKLPMVEIKIYLANLNSCKSL